MLPDFDTLLEMAKHDPQALEQLRQDKSEQLIQQASEDSQRRLRGLLFQIDAQRNLHGCAMGACIKLSNMMQDTFARLPEVMQQLSVDISTETSSKSAKILEFKPQQAEPIAT